MEVEEHGVRYWPGYDKPLVCPAKANCYWVHGDSQYLITEIIGPNFEGLKESGKWFWKVSAVEVTEPALDLSGEGPLG